MTTTWQHGPDVINVWNTEDAAVAYAAEHGWHVIALADGYFAVTSTAAA